MEFLLCLSTEARNSHNTGFVPSPDGILISFLRAKDLRTSLLIMRTCSFLLSCT